MSWATFFNIKLFLLLTDSHVLYHLRLRFLTWFHVIIFLFSVCSFQTVQIWTTFHYVHIVQISIVKFVDYCLLNFIAMYSINIIVYTDNYWLWRKEWILLLPFSTVCRLGCFFVFKAVSYIKVRSKDSSFYTTYPQQLCSLFSSLRQIDEITYQRWRCCR